MIPEPFFAASGSRWHETSGRGRRPRPCSVAAALGALAVASAVAGQSFSVVAQVTPTINDPEDYCGWSIAISGDVIVAGSPTSDVGVPWVPGDEGTVAIIERSGAGWAETASFFGPDPRPSDSLGWSVDVSGDRMIVGAFGRDIAGAGNRGEAYVYRRDASGWTIEATLLAPDGLALENFGYAVAIDGDRAAVGAPIAANGPLGQCGAVHIFERDVAGIWNHVSKLQHAQPASGDWFGALLVLKGDRLFVHARLDDLPGATDAGSVRVFSRGAAGAWAEEATIVAPAPAASDRFGNGFDGVGDTLVVGMRLADRPGATDSGKAFVYRRTPGKKSASWTLVQELVAPDSAAGDSFGTAIACDGDHLYVTARLDDVGGRADEGSMWVFRRDASGAYEPEAQVFSPIEQSIQWFGFSVAAEDGVVAVGAPFANIAGDFNIGAAIVLELAPPSPDLDGDGTVGGSDLAVLLAQWGGGGPADLDGDGTVGAADLAILLGAWGPTGG